MENMPHHLKARVMIGSGGDALVITNENYFPYHNFEIHLNEAANSKADYFCRSSDLVPGERRSYSLTDFSDSNGERFNLASQKVQSVTLETKDQDGSVVRMEEYEFRSP